MAQNRRRREKELRREAILDAAERVLEARGRAATMDEVAEEAQFSKGLLYKYFQNKDDLLAAVSLRAHLLLRSMFAEAVGSGTGRQQISAIGHAYIAFAREHPLYFEALVTQATAPETDDPDSYSAACERAADEVLQIVHDVISRGVQDGSIRPDLDPRETAFLLWGALHGLVTMATFKKVLQRYDQDPQAFLDHALRFLASCMRPTS